MNEKPIFFTFPPSKHTPLLFWSDCYICTTILLLTGNSLSKKENFWSTTLVGFASSIFVVSLLCCLKVRTIISLAADWLPFFSWVQLLVAYRSFHDHLCLPALPALFLLSSCPSSDSILNCRCVAISKRVHILVLQQKSKISFDD